MEKIAVTKLNMSKNSVKTGEKVTIHVFTYNITEETNTKRLPFVLGGVEIKT